MGGIREKRADADVACQKARGSVGETKSREKIR
jgi:hypothetical protein